MPMECPVCQYPIPRTRLFRTSAWGSWCCSRCDSVLDINECRRIVAIAIVTLFAETRQVRVPLAWDLPLVLLTMATVMVPYSLFFERARVLERRGFRCRQCGYDLRGQADPYCPECDQEFDATETARMKLADPNASDQPARRPRRFLARTALIVFALALAVAWTMALVVYTKTKTGGSAPGPTQVSPAGPTDGGGPSSSAGDQPSPRTPNG